MQGSIASHHVQYRIGSRSASAIAMVPWIDRAIQASLAEALETRLGAAFGDAPAVFVVREAKVNVVLSARDCTLSRVVVDQVSAAATDALVARVSTPASADDVVRFPHQAAFVGAFIVEVIAGTAFDRWFFNPLKAYRRATAHETIAAVLADNDLDAVVRWLIEHGHGGVLDVVRRTREHRGAIAADSAREPDRGDSAPLADAAFALLRAMGWSSADVSSPDLCARYLATNPPAPSWTDAASLTAWVAGLIRFALARQRESGALPTALDLTAADHVLDGPLDWLDVAWLRAELRAMHAANGDAAIEAPRILEAFDGVTSRLERALQLMLATARRSGFRMPHGTPREIAVSLLAIAARDDSRMPVGDPTVIAALERIVSAWKAVVTSHRAAQSRDRDASTHSPRQPVRRAERARDLQTAIERIEDLGEPAAALLRELIDTTEREAADGELTAAAGLFLLTRPVLDVRLATLAREVSVPLECALGTLACTLFDLHPPLDGPAAFWVGDARPDFMACPRDDPRMRDLERSVETVLLDQFMRADALGGAADADGHPPIARLVVRAWARWLPGVHGASTSFLVAKCLARAGRVRISRTSIDVMLDPAPLDVVVEMAGCFRSIDAVPWLGGRRMTFARDRRPAKA